MRPCAQCIVDSQRGGVVLQVGLVPVPAVPVSVVAARICAAVRVTSPYSYSLTVNPFEVSALVMAKENPFELAKASEKPSHALNFVALPSKLHARTVVPYADKVSKFLTTMLPFD
jgi:hypothetical protein